MPQILRETGRETQVTRSSDFVNHGGRYVFEAAGEGWQRLPCAGGGASNLLNRLQFDHGFVINLSEYSWHVGDLQFRIGKEEERVTQGRADCAIAA